MDAAYTDRLQTAAKHYILEKYLQKLAFKLLMSGEPVLTYVDGFSGPWESRMDDFSDTSFMIAIGVLKDAHQSFLQKDQKKEIRCFFVESDTKAYRQLEAAVMVHNDPTKGFHVATFHGRFEDAIPTIMTFVGRSFALTFIDPTGWTGYGFPKIAPILTHSRSEVLVNYMYDFINRFTSWDDLKNIDSFNDILGGPDWKQRLDDKLSMGEAVEKLFREQLKLAGRFKFVLSTRIAKIHDRPHFSIAYGTRSPKGLAAFRDVEFAALREHNRNRSAARISARFEATGQHDMFGADLTTDDNLNRVVADQKRLALAKLTHYLTSKPSGMRFSEVCEALLPIFVIRETDAKAICVELAKTGLIGAPWLDRRKRTPQNEDVIKIIK